MAKLIVKTTDSHHKFGFKRGDVVSVLDDDEDEGAMVRNGAVIPDGTGTIRFLFRIVKVPGLASEYAYLTRRGDDVLQGGNVITPIRAVRLDLNAIEGESEAKLGGALPPTSHVDAEKAAIDSLKIDIVYENDLIL